MAARTAFSLGLHQEETSFSKIFNQKELVGRRSLWKTLFVLDRFLSAALGRPRAISETDYCVEALESPSRPAMADITGLDAIQARSLEATVRSSRIIGVILNKTSSTNKISARMAWEATGMCIRWTRWLHPDLNWRTMEALRPNPGHGIAVLYVNLLFCHTVLLYTRPFFLFAVKNSQYPRRLDVPPPTGPRPGVEKLSRACVIASYHTLYLAQKAHEYNLVSRQNPFIQ